MGGKNMAQSTIRIEGMTCGHCVETVTKALEGLSGVSSASVRLEEKQARVCYDDRSLGMNELKKAVEDAGFEVPSGA